MIDPNEDTQILCPKHLELELLLKNVTMNEAHQIHMEYKRCIESDCKGIDEDCDLYKSYILNRKLLK